MKKQIFKLPMMVCMALMATQALAEEPNIPAKPQDPPAVATRMDSMVVTATRTKTSAFDVPASASVVDADTIEQDRPDNLADILESIPGVDISGDAAHAQQPALRGLPESQTIIKVDGARENYVQKAGDAQSTILVDPDLLKEVEVVRGPASVMHGAGGIGGVISLTTKDAADLLKPGRNVGAMVKGGVSTAGDETHGTAAAFGRYGNLDILATGTLRDLGDVETSTEEEGKETVKRDGKIKNAMVKATYTPTDAHTFSLNATRFDQDTTYKKDASRYQAEQDKLIGTWRLTPDSPLVDAKVTALWSKRDETVENNITDKLEFTSMGIDAQNIMAFNTGISVSHRLVFGADAYRDEYTPKAGDPMMAYTNPPGHGEDAGAFIQDEITVPGGFTLIPALRYTWYSRTGENSESPDGTEDRVSPKMTVDWKPVPWAGFHTTYAESFRAPLVSEMFTELDSPHPFNPMIRVKVLANPDLKPEQADTWEWGARFAFDGLLADDDALRIKGVYFQEKIEDLIDAKTLQMPAPPDFEFVSTMVNVESVKREGYELELAYKIKNLSLLLGHSKIKGQDEKTKENAGETPATTLVRADYLFKALNLKLGWRARFVESFENGDDEYESYEVHSLSSTFRPTWFQNRDLALYLNVDNLFDESYDAYHFKNSGPGGARSIKAGMSMMF